MRVSILSGVIVCLAASIGSAQSDGTFGPYIQNLTSTSGVVCWVTATAGIGTVQYGTTPSYGSTATQAVSVREHQVLLPSLRPATRYFYRASGGGLTVTGDFRTAVTGNAPFAFVAMGETHTEPVVATYAEEVAAVDPHFIIDASDQVDYGLVRGEWDQFFTIGQAFYPRTPLFGCVGNHTYMTSWGFPLPGSFGKVEFKRIMNNPGNEEWFSSRCGNTQFIALNSTYYYEDPSRILVTQRAWLESTLAAATDGVNDPTFKVVYMHVPLFSSGPLYREALERIPLRAAFQSLFERYGVDLVISGHDKMNEHSLRNGVHYTQIATGELGYPIQTSNPSSLWRTRVQRAILTVQVSAGSMACRYVDPNGVVLHSFSIVP